MKTTDTLPLVSIVCESYNHEPFLRRCLDGFVMQKTDFPFEILIHDDASTDRSADIIREYEIKYPNLFKPIYQKENQYSKGVKIWADIQFPRAKGKYIALCEGDDYWTDSLKLQKQVDYMESHPDCSFCFHNAVIHTYDGSQPDKLYSERILEKDYSAQELLGQHIPPTASFVFRSDLSAKYHSIMHREHLAVGDRPLKMLCAQSGTAHGLADIMSVYGKHSSGWTNFEEATKTFDDARSWEVERELYGKECREISTSIMTGLYLNALGRALKQRNIRIALKSFYRGVLLQPLTGIKALAKLPGERRARISGNK